MSSSLLSPIPTRAPVTTTTMPQRSEARRRRLVLLSTSNPPKPPKPPDPPPTMPPDPPPLPGSQPLLHDFSLSNSESLLMLSHPSKAPLLRLMFLHVTNPAAVAHPPSLLYTTTISSTAPPRHRIASRLFFRLPPTMTTVQRLRPSASQTRNGNRGFGLVLGGLVSLSLYNNNYTPSKVSKSPAQNTVDVSTPVKRRNQTAFSLRGPRPMCLSSSLWNNSKVKLTKPWYSLFFENRVFSETKVDTAWNTSSLLRCKCWIFKDARQTFAAQGCCSQLWVSSALLAETLAFKAAFTATLTAALTLNLLHLNVFSDSKVLVSLLTSQGVINELESILYDIQCLITSFSSIAFSHIPRLDIVVANGLAKTALLSSDV